jgi:hypothetical protein
MSRGLGAAEMDIFATKSFSFIKGKKRAPDVDPRKILTPAYFYSKS